MVIGTGGVGMNAVQGARHAGAEQIVAVDPVEWKRQAAIDTFGATHSAASVQEALELVMEITRGVGADRGVITMGVGDGKILNDAQMLVRKGGMLVFTSAAPLLDMDVTLNLYTFAMSNKRLQGTLYGSVNPRVDVPRLLNLYRRGELKLDELISRTYTLEEINQGWKDLERRPQPARGHPLRLSVMAGAAAHGARPVAQGAGGAAGAWSRPMITLVSR